MDHVESLNFFVVGSNIFDSERIQEIWYISVTVLVMYADDGVLDLKVSSNVPPKQIFIFSFFVKEIPKSQGQGSPEKLTIIDVPVIFLEYESLLLQLCIDLTLLI